MFVSVSLGCCLDGLVGAILLRAAMIAVFDCYCSVVQDVYCVSVRSRLAFGASFRFWL